MSIERPDVKVLGGQKETELEYQFDRVKLVNDLFTAPGITWGFTGGIAFGLRKGEFTKIHKDIDVFINENDLVKLRENLRSKGYDLVVAHLRTDDPTKESHEPFDMQMFREQGGFLLIMKDSTQSVASEADFMRYVDIFCIRLDEEGHHVDKLGTPLPEDWFTNDAVNMNGVQFPVENARKTIFYRLADQKNFEDIKKFFLSQSLTVDDIDIIEQTLIDRYDRLKKQIELIAVQVMDIVVVDRKNEEMIYDKIAQLPLFNAYRDQPNFIAILKQIAHAIATASHNTFSEILKAIGSVYDYEAIGIKYREQVQELRQMAYPHQPTEQ